MCIILGDVTQFIVNCLIPLDPWIIVLYKNESQWENNHLFLFSGISLPENQSQLICFFHTIGFILWHGSQGNFKIARYGKCHVLRHKNESKSIFRGFHFPILLSSNHDVFYDVTHDTFLIYWKWQKRHLVMSFMHLQLIF